MDAKNVIEILPHTVQEVDTLHVLDEQVTRIRQVDLHGPLVPCNIKLKMRRRHDR